MLSLDHEGHEHYEEFFDTVRFLFADRGKDEVKSLRKDLEAFREQLETGAFLQGNDQKLLTHKSDIETRLRNVICRTERNAYIQDPIKGVQEVQTTAVPQEQEVVDYIRLRKFLLDKVDTSQHITEYWKSCPAPFTFMDAHYAPMAKAKHTKAVVPQGIVEPASKLDELARRNLRFRELFRAVLGAPDTPWKFLWTRPSYTYYRDEFFEDVDPVKLLVFSGWRFVPKSIALLTSYEAEQRIAPDKSLWDKKIPPPLRFTERRSYHIFDLCFPSPALAQLVEPASLAGEELTATEVLERTKKAVKEALSKAEVVVADTSRSPLWQVVARLEKQANTSVNARLRESSSYSGKDSLEYFKERVAEFAGWMNDRGSLQISEERLTHLARIVAFSPALALLRAFWSTFSAERGQVPAGMVDLCFGALRSYFNRRTVQVIIKRNMESRSYARAVLEYCERAHFQAVVDEYLYLGKNVLQRSTPCEMAEHLARVLGIGTGSPNINQTTDKGRLKHDQHTGRAHFALAFGDDLQPDQASDLKQSAPGRKTAVREAFNSPFWPFVLATTSVGQEGLDFHLFCRDVVHWNLPSNPVDLEQREGRINRRDGLAVRRAIAREWPISRLAETLPADRRSFWEHVFDVVSRAPDIQRYKHGLYPHWVFEPQVGQVERIRRHLFFYTDSQDVSRYEELKERLTLYRLVFGQPRQQDLLDRIRRMVQPGRDVGPAVLTRYMINLSPLGEAHAVARAALEADEIAGSAEKLIQLLLDIEQIEIERSAELLPISHELDQLKAIVKQQLQNSDQNVVQLTIAIRALIYLRDPYDAVMDQHINLGLDDDLGRIRLAARAAAGNSVG
jgi:hypothetical protein